MTSYHEAKAFAENRRQNAMREARRQYEVAVSGATLRHRAARVEAQQAFDFVKADPAAKGHDEARRAYMEINSTTADLDPARQALDRAVTAADAAYHAELFELSKAHGVSIR